MYHVILYRNKNGKSEIEEYLLKLKQMKDKSSRIKLNKIIAYIEMLTKYGTNMGTQYIKHIESNIWELRPLKDRIFFSYLRNDIFILISVFRKQTQKTPKLEIEKAKNLLNEFIGRNEKNE